MRRLSILLLFLLPLCANAQKQKLSASDSIKIQKHLESYESELKSNDRKEAARHLNDAAFIYWNYGHNQEAIRYYEQSLKLNEQLGNNNAMTIIHSRLGELYADIRNYDKSLDYFNQALAIRRANRDDNNVMYTLISISGILNNLKRYEESAERLKDALSIATKMKDAGQMKNCYIMLAETYEMAGNTEQSLNYMQLYKTFQQEELKELKTEVQEEKLLKQRAEAQSQISQRELEQTESALSEFESENRQLVENLSKKELQLEVLGQKAEIERLKADEERNQNLAALERERSIRNMVILGALFLAVITFFIIRNFIQVKRSQKLLAQKNEQIAAQNQKLEELNQIVQAQNKRMRSELNIGREIQMSMIHQKFPAFPERNEFDIYAVLHPAREVGGDLYDFFMIDEEHLCFTIGDVSDKGVPAALMMAVTRTLIKTHALYNLRPADIVTQVNDELSKDNDTFMFVTLFLCVLNLKTGRLQFTNAGHNPPLVKRANGDIEILRELHGPVAGVMEHLKYKQSESDLLTGDRIILFTDGVTEAMDEKKRLYSDQKFQNLIREMNGKPPRQIVEDIVKSVIEFRGSAEQSDDITVLSLEMNEGSAGA